MLKIIVGNSGHKGVVLVAVSQLPDRELRFMSNNFVT